MPVKVRCPGCKKVLNAPEKARGKGVRCPHCQTAVRIPAEGAGTATAAPAKAPTRKAEPVRKKSAAKGPDSVAMIAALDLGKLEDHRTRICPRCTAEVPEEEVECPKCGVNVETGVLSEKSLRKRQRKGPDPSLFYKDAIKSSFRFMFQNWFLVGRSIGIFTVAAVLMSTSIIMTAYVSSWPLQAFWIFVGIVTSLIPLGWTWVLQEAVIDISLAKKDKIRPKDFRLDVFLCASHGLKVWSWLIVFSLPVQVITGTLGGVLFAMGQQIAGAVSIAAGFLIAFLLQPIAVTHLTMPVTYRAWLFPVIGKVFLRIPFPTIYAGILRSIGVAVIIAAIAAPFAIFAADLGAIAGRMQHNRDTNWAKAYVPNVGQKIPPEIQTMAAQPLTALEPDVKHFIPFATWVVCCIPLGFVVVFNARVVGRYAMFFREDLDLISQAEELKYIPKAMADDDVSRKENEAKDRILVLVVMLVMGLVGGIAVGILFPDIGLVAGLGWGLVGAGVLIGGIATVAIRQLARETSFLWMVAVLVFPPSQWLWCVLYWEEAKSVVIYWIFSFAFILPGAGLVLLGMFTGSPPAA